MLVAQKEVRIVISTYDGETFPLYSLRKITGSVSEADVEATALVGELLKRGWEKRP